MRVNKYPNICCLQYDATIFGGYGGGGEYVLQTGFGWTNGVVMALLNRYGGERFTTLLTTGYGRESFDDKTSCFLRIFMLGFHMYQRLKHIRKLIRTVFVQMDMFI